MSEKYTSFDEMPVMLNAAQLAAIFGISRSGSYKLIKVADFPTVKIGKKVVVPKDALKEWVAKQSSVWHYAFK